MSVATLQSDPLPAVAVHGEGIVRFKQRDGLTCLDDLYHTDPVRILFPYKPKYELPTAVITTTSGGLVGGDRIEITASVAEGASALVTPQAAEKVYRSAGEDTHIAVDLEVAPGGWLEWLPQETIVFNGSRLRRVTRASIKGDGALLAGEFLVFGRKAHGETLTEGLLRDAWEIRRDGKLIWADALHLENDLATPLAARAGFDGAEAIATIVYAGPGAEVWLDAVRGFLGEAPEGLRFGATLVNGLLVIRFIGKESLILRKSYGAFWARFRSAIAGLPDVLPRLWHI